jgi:hypothetical protein
MAWRNTGVMDDGKMEMSMDDGVNLVNVGRNCLRSG